MIKKIFPLVLLATGIAAGAGAGIFLRPAPALEEIVHGDDPTKDAGQPKTASDDHGGGRSEVNANEDRGNDNSTSEFVKLNNQFVVPIVRDEKVTALVVMGLSIEVPSGTTDEIYRREPKLRDSFLQVLFDHANMGGFDGAFTDAQMLGRLRTALREVARRDMGGDTVKDVLIVEIARQDY